MKLSAEAAQLNDLIDTKYTRIRLLIEKDDFFKAGCSYCYLELVRDEILFSYDIGNIDRLEKELLLDNLSHSMTRIMCLVKEDKNETIDKRKSNL